MPPVARAGRSGDRLHRQPRPFLLNDLAHALDKPVLFASVRQYEGSCRWCALAVAAALCSAMRSAEATRATVRSATAEGGVFGPGTRRAGSPQALEAREAAARSPGQLDDEGCCCSISARSTIIRIRGVP